MSRLWLLVRRTVRHIEDETCERALNEIDAENKTFDINLLL